MTGVTRPKAGVEKLIGARPGLRGLPGLRVAPALADGRAESPVETRVRLVLQVAGLPAPVPQHRIFRGRRFLARVDLAYPDRRIAIEYEGDPLRTT